MFGEATKGCPCFCSLDTGEASYGYDDKILNWGTSEGVESINKITGEHKLNDLKQAVSSTEVTFNQSKMIVSSLEEIEDVVKQRSQRNILLLQRKTEWNEKDETI